MMADLLADELAADHDGEAEPSRPKPCRLCPARWGREKGYIEVRDPGDGSVHEIPYHQATDVWKGDIREQRRERAGREKEGRR